MSTNRRATMRAASAALAVASVFLLATCDLDKLTKPDDGSGGSGTSLIDSTDLQLTGLSNGLSWGGTGTMDVISSSVSLNNVIKRFYSASPQFIAVDSITGALTGVSLGTSKLTAKILAPELPTGVTISTNVRVKYKGVKITSITAGDSISGLGQTRTLTIFGMKADNSIVGSALVADSLRSRDTTVLKVTGTTVNARKNGTAYLVAIFDGLKDSVALKVRQVAKSITFPTTDYTARHVNFNLTVPLTVRDVSDSIIPTPTMTWTTKDTTKATITAAGVLKVKAAGITDTVFAQRDTVKRGQRIIVQQVPSFIAKFAGDAQTDTVAQNIAIVPTVTVTDSGLTGIAGVSVVFKPGVGLNATVQDTLQVTDVNGRAKPTNWKLGDAVGNQTLVATAGTLTTTFTATAVNNLAKKLAFSVSPTSASVNTAITPAIKVQVTDSLGNPVTTGVGANVPVTLSISNNAGGATLNGTLTQNAVAGVATFNNISLNAAGSGYTLQASAGGMIATISDAFDIFGAATKLGFTTQPVSTSQGATMATVRVAIQDAAGNTVGNSTANVTLSIGTNPGGSTLGGTVTKAAVAGVATFSNLTINNAGSNYTLQAASGVLTGAVSDPFNVAVVGAPAKLAISVQPSNVVAGASISPGIQVQVLDANGGLVTTSSQQITLTIDASSPSGASISGTLPKNAVNGVVTFSDVSINKAGTGYKLVASAPATSITSATSTSFNVTAGAATKLGFVQQPTHTTTATNIAPAVTVEVQDAGGNRVTTGPTFQVSLTMNACGGTLSGGGAQTTSAGLATFSALQVNALATGCQLTASAPSLTNSPSSQSFNIINATAASRVKFTTQPSSSVTAGAVFGTAPVVSYQTASGTTVTASSATPITLSIVSTAPQTFFNNGGGTSAATSTTATFSNIILQKAGSYRFVATATGYDPDTSDVITINPSTASKWGVLVQPSSVVAGVPFPSTFTASVQDQFGNTIPGATNSITLFMCPSLGGNCGSFSAGPNYNGQSVSATAVDGVATFNGLAPKTAMSAAHICSSNTGALGGFCSGTFDVATGPLSKLGFTVQPSLVSTGENFASAVKVAGQDSVGNTVSDFGNAVTVAMTGGNASATLGGTKTKAPVGGVATFDDLTVDIASQGYKLSASASGVTTANSNTFNVDPQFLFTCCPGFEDMARVGSTIYFVGNSALKSVPINGTTVTNIVGSTNANDIVTDGTNIYWAERGTNNNGDAFIKKLTVSNGNISTLTVAQTNLMDWQEMKLATDGVNVYFVARNLASTGYAIKSVPVGAVSAAPTEIYSPGTFEPVFFTLNGGFIYFYDATVGTVRRMTTAGGSVTTLSSGSISAKLLAMSGTTLIFNDGVAIKAIANANSAGGAVTPTTLTTASGTVWEIAADGSSVYVSSDSRLRRYEAANFANFVDLIVTSPGLETWYRNFVFDATHVYFYTNFGRLAKAPK